MADAFQITPAKPHTGMPISITVTFPEGTELPTILNVTKESGNPSSFHAPLQKIAQHRVNTEFALFEAGSYQLQAGQLRSSLSISEQTDLSFLIEFGILASLVIFFLGGLIIWNRKKLLPR